MVFQTLIILSTKLLALLAWPPFALIYPLCATVRAMESNSHANNRQCLCFWVVFGLFNFTESSVATLLLRLPFWPYLKGMIVVLLVLPYFDVAAYIYKRFIKDYVSDSLYSKMWNWNSMINFSTQIERNSKPDCLLQFADFPDREMNSNATGKEKLNVNECVEGNHERSLKGRKVQKEWSCALCQINMKSEKCLEKHLQGRKHKVLKDGMTVDLLVTNSTFQIPSKLKKTDRVVFLENINQIVSLLNPVSRSTRWCSWIKPDVGWTKLNADGSVHRENARFGGLLRDYKGDPICAYVSKAAIRDIFLVELWAIWRGLVLASGLGIKLIWVESDSMSVVKTINKQQLCCQKAGGCLERVWELLSKFEKFKVSHSWRESNRAADHLAKMVLMGNDVVLWPSDLPKSLGNIIKEDAKGKKYLRW